ncbi:hypothetical protein CHH58_10365 [Terribacillus saccharophilus]|uniref:lipopolysaccharide biosynthesis protein n=1 Tax=Terribacillus saccharophilus TaxID=361277 RepID=UPI000BA605E3|nr:lipopolysaccharide biosynthesis protein [Terribacillus saccharophilus]PAF37233.1 hypothetical protein CHH58_10365 [Terribacillus saccharophilus]
MVKLIFKYAPSVIIPTMLSLILFIIYGNHLSPSSYGKYNLFMTTVILLDSTLIYFMYGSILRLYNNYHRQGQVVKLFSTFTLLTVIIVSSLFILGVLINKPILSYLSLALCGFSFINILSNYIRAQNNLLLFNILKMCPPIFTLLCILLIIFFDKLSVESAVFSLYGPMLIVSLIIIVIFYLKKKFIFNINIKIISDAFTYGVPLTVVGLMGFIISSSSRYIISFVLGDEQLGYYSFSYKLAELLLVTISMSIVMAMYPQLIKEYEEKGRFKAEDLLKRFVSVHFIIVIPVICLLFLFVDDVVEVLFSQYKDAASLIKFTSLALIFLSLTFYTNKGFELTKNTKQMMFILIWSAIISVVLNIILIPILGLNGSIVSTLISYLIYVVISIIKSKKNFTIKFPYKNILWIFLISLLLCFPVKLISFSGLNNFANTIICIAIYLGLYSFTTFMLIKVKLLKF